MSMISISLFNHFNAHYYIRKNGRNRLQVGVVGDMAVSHRSSAVSMTTKIHPV